MSARADETRRRRARRRDELVRLRREFVCGGPLVDHAAPIVGGGDAEHMALIEEEVRRRVAAIQREGALLAEDFARGCWVTSQRHFLMLLHWDELMRIAGPPSLQTTHTTHPTMRTSRGTIPRL